MHYFIFEKTLDDVVYSCDKICLMGKIEFSCIDSFPSELSNLLLGSYASASQEGSYYPFEIRTLKDYSFYERLSVSQYRNNFNIVLSDDSSFYFAYRHNSSNGDKVAWKIELNPNKCLPCDFVERFINFVVSRSKPSSVHFSQMDIAIDFPIERVNFYLNKDRRISTVVNDGYDNTTEYLSKHNEHGFVKLYNKQIESKLEHPLTRLEITLKKFTYNDFVSVFPVLHVYFNSQINFNNILEPLSQNDEVFVSLLRLHPEYYKKLSYRKQKRFEPYLNVQSPMYEPDIYAYQNLIDKVCDYFYVSK